MIQWTLTLTGNQIAILKALETRVFGEPWDGTQNISHWVGGVRTLLREGLVEFRETKARNGIHLDMSRSGQFLTERGRFILKRVEGDIAKFLSPDTAKKIMRDRAKANSTAAIMPRVQ